MNLQLVQVNQRGLQLLSACDAKSLGITKGLVKEDQLGAEVDQAKEVGETMGEVLQVAMKWGKHILSTLVMAVVQLGA